MPVMIRFQDIALEHQLALLYSRLVSGDTPGGRTCCCAFWVSGDDVLVLALRAAVCKGHDFRLSLRASSRGCQRGVPFFEFSKMQNRMIELG